MLIFWNCLVVYASTYLAHHQPESSAIVTIATDYVLRFVCYNVVVVVIIIIIVTLNTYYVTIMTVITTVNQASLHVPAVAASSGVRCVCGMCADVGV